MCTMPNNKISDILFSSELDTLVNLCILELQKEELNNAALLGDGQESSIRVVGGATDSRSDADA